MMMCVCECVIVGSTAAPCVAAAPRGLLPPALGGRGGGEMRGAIQGPVRLEEGGLSLREGGTRRCEAAASRQGRGCAASAAAAPQSAVHKG